MRQLLKNIYQGGVNLLKTMVSAISVPLFNKHGINKKIRVMRKEPKRESVSILAGGPSAKEVLSKRRDLLKDTDLLVLNYFGNTPDFFALKPRYYILLDPAFFDANHREKLDEKNIDTSRSHVHKLIENFGKVDWPMTLFLPYHRGGAKVLGERMEYANIKIIQFNGTRILGFSWFQNWMYRHNQGLPSSRNVILPAMMLMANIGYKTMFLYGCEFSWTKTMDIDPENGMMFFNDRHFYSKSEIRYFGKGAYKWWLECIVDDLQATEQIAQYAKSIGVNIVNRTKGSFIDAFGYENPDSIKI